MDHEKANVLFVDDEQTFLRQITQSITRRSAVFECHVSISEGEALNVFTNAYRTGVVSSTKFKAEEKYELTVTNGGTSAPYYFRLIQNPFTNKWKILEP